ncbi:CHAT domain-containing protein [Actinokineospora globicatena]|uniref:CHAT domain-containing protein n=1 Tax=Actinokineospora globicatena TaxID=103729 RepID=UPI0020A41300|nr:CHAT domain-containing protein [Actinokineospora globicatena]MCP2302893.1 CHAT domain-containing protein [Actinokineospora globicatena]GLW78724.1 hypothetical protein Aglo01_32060 [Actinokineospora globicatena]GLW84608.1 hypothetical protein Aglo02_22480 [Actinokineospora globicatena]
MAETPTAHEEAIRLAALLREDPDRVDPETAAEVGTALLHALEESADTGAVRLVTTVLGFALHSAPEHPSAPRWWSELGFAHGWIAEDTGSAAEFDTAITCSLMAVSTPQAPPEVAEGAAVDAAHLTGSLLRLEGVTADRARQLIQALDEIALTWTDSLDAAYFEFNMARALWWAEPLTEDTSYVRRAADILRRALAAPVLAEAGQDCVEEWELFAGVLETVYLDTGDRGLLDELLAAAVTVRDSRPADHERLPVAHGIVAAVAEEIFWTSGGEASAALDTAVTSFAAKRAAVGLNDDEAVSYALLLQIRGCDAEDVPALTAAVAVLEDPARAPGAEMVLSGLHGLLVHLDDPRHAWSGIDWATRALAGAELTADVVFSLHSSRIDCLAAALEAFGGAEVAARCDVDGVLAGARIEALADDDVERAELELRTARLRAQWAADRFPLDLDLFQETSAQMADAVLRMADHVEPDRVPALRAAATLLKDMVPVVLGERDPGPFHAALQHASLREHAEVAGLVEWVEQQTKLKAMLAKGTDDQEVGAQLKEMVGTALGGMSESHRAAGMDALVPIMEDLADVVASSRGSAAARAAAFQRILRRCEELPEPVASSPFVQRLRGGLSAQLAVGGHDGDQVEPAIGDLELALEREDGRWPDDGAHIVERLGDLLRQRGGPGDAARARRLGLRALSEQAWRAMTRPRQEQNTQAPRFARVVGAWCHEDGDDGDLVRVVEAQRCAAVAHSAGVQLVRELLVGTGRAALADQWVAAAATEDAWAARRLGLAALLSEEDKAALTGPLGPEDIQPLLRARGLDALLYLARSHGRPGGVVAVVTAEGEVSSAHLPLLSEEWFTEAPTTTAATLDALGGWAWLAGGAAVFAAARAAAPGRVPRVALVPVGALGAVPWAAAWRKTGTGRRYLVQDVEITLLPSARLLATAPAGSQDPVLVRGGPDRMPGSDYDEASEPACALLATGTRSVVRGVWPHAADSALFALFQHFLGENPTRPAAALRAAQLWLLDPRRVLPTGLSASDLADPADIANWGGFAHVGA